MTESVQKIKWESGSHSYDFFSLAGEKYFFDPQEFDCSSVAGEHITYSIPFRDGQKFLSARLTERYISFKAIIDLRDKSESEIAELTEDIAEGFYPARSGTLHRYVGTRHRLIGCMPKRTPLLTQRVGKILFYAFEFAAPDPYWLGDLCEYDIGQTITAGFPLYFGGSISYVINDVALTNNCEHDVYPIIEIFEPTKLVNNTTGVFIEVTRQIGNNQKLVIDTYNDSVTLMSKAGGVWIESSDESAYITPESGIFTLAPGANSITAVKSGESLEPSIHIAWRERYAGV